MWLCGMRIEPRFPLWERGGDRKKKWIEEGGKHDGARGWIEKPVLNL